MYGSEVEGEIGSSSWDSGVSKVGGWVGEDCSVDLVVEKQRRYVEVACMVVTVGVLVNPTVAR